MPRGRRLGLITAAALVLTACAAPSPPPTTTPASSASPANSLAPSAGPTVGAVEPAPGSASVVYEPNPAAIVVAIDAGHGGCLDWGVPDPSERGVELAEKTLTLGIAQRLRDRLEADGITVLMIRDADEALAGDDYPDLGCTGPPWRDVDGDGRAGFEETGRVRTRDELQARIDLANLTGADAFVSIHINSLTQDGVVFEIAASQTYFDDETPWGVEGSGDLAADLQDGVVDAIEPLATYDREDRGTEAVAFYAISRTWADGDSCEVSGDEFCKPQRGLLMPSALSEVGSITLRAEHDLLASSAGQDAIADGLFRGIAGHLGARELAGRIGLVGVPIGEPPAAAEADGPPFWPPVVAPRPIELRVTNTGTSTWAAGTRIVVGWTETDRPYLAIAPDEIAQIGADLPRLEPGDSTVVAVGLSSPSGARAVAWVTLQVGDVTLADVGSPALQLAGEGP